MSSAPALTLRLAAQAENIAIVRQAVAGLGETANLDGSAIADLKTAVSEACMNAAIHAYEGAAGPLEVSAWLEEDGVRVAVRDQGVGFRPRPADVEGGPLRLGLPLIAALSDNFEISGAVGKGTEVRISKRSVPDLEQPEAAPGEAVAATTLGFSREAPVQPILARVLGALAARANLSIDRLSDMLMLGDAISAEAPADAPGEELSISIADSAGRLELRVGPLEPGGAERLLGTMEIPGPPASSLRELATEVRTEALPEGGEQLLITIEEDAAAREVANQPSVNQ
jgi:serine/threonine-protein kinase RsbW